MMECNICLKQGRTCSGEGGGRFLSPKGKKALIRFSKQFADSHYDESILTVDKVWVSNSCYKRYTDRRESNVQDQSEISSAPCTRAARGSLAYDYKTHCLICAKLLDFASARKHPKRPKCQISKIELVNERSKKCKVQETLKAHCKGKSDALSVEVAARIEYASCIRAEEAKYHRHCMQSFLSGSGASLDIDTETKSNISVSKNETFEQFCEWYESTDHATSSMTLFEVQKQMRDLCPSEGGVYSIKWISKRLLERYGNKIQVTASTGRPNIILLRKEADQIVAENIPMVIPQNEVEAHTLEEPMTCHDEDVSE